MTKSSSPKLPNLELDQLLFMLEPDGKKRLNVSKAFNTIVEAAAQMIRLAQLTHKQISFEFNDLTMRVREDSKVKNVRDNYYRRLKERCEKVNGTGNCDGRLNFS